MPPCSPTLAKCVSLRLLLPLYDPIIKLQDRIPHLKRFFTKYFHLFPDANVQKLKGIVDVMDSTSRMLYEEKKNALSSGEVDMKLRVEEGKDLMSVLRKVPPYYHTSKHANE